ncbi:MAG: hypothetical protein HYW86_00160 [Candidatus Roizmanbacteria bacterium]|nr:MAG: hypothetical protein HYW86_00160 [Candidatus Roizmanbacteria bacterium]
MRIITFIPISSRMLGIIAGIIVITVITVIFPREIFAANNKFGIHLAVANLEDIKKAADLVNSTGGKWGYVTLVIQENDRNREKWQEVFDFLREFHLIPLIRLATNPQSNFWKRPQKEDVDEWVNFLESLNWVVKNRYIILFNEPNHGLEWGGTVDPEGYANIAKAFAEKLKTKNKDYFIMLAGLDASAPSSSPLYEDEAFYLDRVINTISSSKFNELFSGWVSHSYPNPGFLGSVYDTGRGTLKTYQWELEILGEKGIKDLPVFITETGWDGGRMSKERIGDLYKTAFESIWVPDERVKAVTPFVLSYLSEPFAIFSWIAPDNQNFYPQYYVTQNISKVKGSPEIVEKGQIITDLPEKMIVKSTYRFKITLINEGQALWDKSDGYELAVDDNPYVEALFDNISKIKPGGDQSINVTLKTKQDIGKGKLKISLKKDNQKIIESKEWLFEILPLPRLEFKIGFFPKVKAQAKDVELQIFNDNEELIYKEKNIPVSQGKGIIEKVPNIIVGRRYRLVVLRPYYLPRQKHIIFQKDLNQTGFTVMLPLDFNIDGKFNLADLGTLWNNKNLSSLWFIK